MFIFLQILVIIAALSGLYSVLPTGVAPIVVGLLSVLAFIYLLKIQSYIGARLTLSVPKGQLECQRVENT
jgi:hypothetical protein